MIKMAWIKCVSKEKKSSFAIWVFRTPLPFREHNQQLHKCIIKKEAFIKLNEFHTFGKL